MASDGTPGKIPVASPVHGSQAVTFTSPQLRGGNALPPGGKAAATVPAERTAQAPVAKSAASAATDARAVVQQLNRHFNNSGRPDQFRLDPTSDGKIIQQVNPANGEVIGEFSSSEFPALARSVGVLGQWVDSLA